MSLTTIILGCNVSLSSNIMAIDREQLIGKFVEADLARVAEDSCFACPDRKCDTIAPDGLIKGRKRMTYLDSGTVVNDYREKNNSIEKCTSPLRAAWLLRRYQVAVITPTPNAPVEVLAEEKVLTRV